MNNSTSLSIPSSQLLVQPTASEFWKWAQAATNMLRNSDNVNSLRQVTRETKVFPKQENIPGTLFRVRVSCKALGGNLWSTAEPAQGRAEQDVIGGGQKGGSRGGEWDVELQGQSSLDSKAAAQDFSRAALLCS